MNKFAKIGVMCLAIVLTASIASAQDTDPANPRTLIDLSGAFGAGLVVIGAAMGIGRLAAAALESMARQPEVAGNIQTAMIIAAALIEGVALFAEVICILLATK